MTAFCPRPGGGHGVGISFLSVHLLLPVLLFFGFLAGAAEAQSPGFSSYGTNGTQFNSSMAIIVVVLISVFFLMGFLSIYLRQCSERDEVSLGRNPAGRWRRPPPGLDAAVIETFPKLVYADVKDHKMGKGALECAVCLSEFDDDDDLRLLPKCDHVFHPDCIDAWLSAHTTCPVCRADLLPDSDDHRPVAAAAAAESAPPAAAVPPQSPPAASPARQSDHVAITIDEGPPRPEAPPRKTSLPPLPPASRRPKQSARPPKFSRSNSTGHSIVVVHAADCDRFTLRLPEHIRRDVMEGKLRRSTSFATFPQEADVSVRKGYSGGEGSSRGGRSFKPRPERWAFFSRTFSMKSPKRDGAGEDSTKRGAEAGDLPVDGSVKAKQERSVRSPLDCLGGGAADNGDSLSKPNS